eukprot:487438-Prymnesium_polylepis.1
MQPSEVISALGSVRVRIVAAGRRSARAMWTCAMAKIPPRSASVSMTTLSMWANIDQEEDGCVHDEEQPRVQRHEAQPILQCENGLAVIIHRPLLERARLVLAYQRRHDVIVDLEDEAGRDRVEHDIERIGGASERHAGPERNTSGHDQCATRPDCLQKDREDHVRCGTQQWLVRRPLPVEDDIDRRDRHQSLDVLFANHKAEQHARGKA